MILPSLSVACLNHSSVANGSGTDSKTSHPYLPASYLLFPIPCSLFPIFSPLPNNSWRKFHGP